ncbi:MAG: DUF3105 domain-containing protein [Cryobacterium sp.]|nr:DUF3105 domain-containing protein [Micrococcales bacterium]MBX3309003.1 DUF3105 domain-containing protein [Cryobacterium sp.]
MTPSRSSDPTPDSKNLTIKQQRAANRTRKVEEFHRRQKQNARNRKLAIIGGIVVTVVAASLLISFVVFAPTTPKNAKIEGVQTFKNTAGHITTPITYDQIPPAGGEHNPVWLNCGVYTQPVPNENAVHSLEHGAIWVTYDPSLGATELDTLRSELPSTYVIVSPYENLPSKIVLSGWNVQLQIESADDRRLADFVKKYRGGANAPEPGGACTGGVDGPGKVS